MQSAGIDHTWSQSKEFFTDLLHLFSKVYSIVLWLGTLHEAVIIMMQMNHKTLFVFK